MTIKLITFKTNQTLIAEVVSENEQMVVLKQPVQVIVQPTKEGPMMGFSPFLEFSEEFKTGIGIPKEKACKDHHTIIYHLVCHCNSIAVFV